MKVDRILNIFKNEVVFRLKVGIFVNFWIRVIKKFNFEKTIFALQEKEINFLINSSKWFQISI